MVILTLTMRQITNERSLNEKRKIIKQKQIITELAR